MQAQDNLYNNSNDSFREGVNEMIEDEANMAQKTAYYLKYNSKFNKINSEELGVVSSMTRAQMMPSNFALP